MPTHPLQTATGSTINDCSSTTGWALIAGASLTLAAPPDSRFGTTPRLLMTSAVNSAAYMDLTLAQVLSGRLAFLMYLDAYDSGAGSTQNTKSFTVYCSDDAGFSNYYYRSGVLRQGWNLITFSRQDQISTSTEDCTWRKIGSPSWSNNKVRVRVRVEAQSGTATRLYLCNMRDGYYHRPQIILGFDDGLANTVTVAKPTMDTYGLKGVCYIIGSRVDSGGNYASAAQLQTLYDAGWDLSNHSWTHPTGHQADSQATWENNEIIPCRDLLIANGWTRRNCHLHYAAPNGEATYREAGAYRAAIANTCLTGRSTVERNMGAYVDDVTSMYCIIPDGSVETLQDQIDRITAATGAGGTIQLLFHEIVTPANSQTKWTPTNFTALMKHLYKLKEGGVIDVPTLTEWYEKVSGQSALTG